MTLSPELIGTLSIILAIAGYYRYVQTMLQRKTKPHAFSWAIWALLTGIAFVAQVSDGAGAGAWAIGFTALVCGLISIFAFAGYGEKSITRGDWISLIFCLSAIPLWIITEDPLWSVLLITTIDMVSYYPTFRKSYIKPYEENLFHYSVATLKFVLSMMALENISIITALYPASLIFANVIFVMMVAWRRYTLSTSQ